MTQTWNRCEIWMLIQISFIWGGCFRIITFISWKLTWMSPGRFMYSQYRPQSLELQNLVGSKLKHWKRQHLLPFGAHLPLKHPGHLHTILRLQIRILADNISEILVLIIIVTSFQDDDDTNLEGVRAVGEKVWCYVGHIVDEDEDDNDNTNLEDMGAVSVMLFWTCWSWRWRW